MIAEYRTHLSRRATTRLTGAFPGVAEALAALPGKKSTATTKGTPTTRAVLEQFGLLPYFDHVQGTDGFPCKPAPDVILTSLAALGAQPEDCLFVGDSPPTWKPAGAPASRPAPCSRATAARETGALEPDYWIEHPSELRV